MVKKILFDTNVILEDPRVFLKHKDQEILVPVAIIKELDRKKTGFGLLHRNSREATRILEKIRTKEIRDVKVRFIPKSEYDDTQAVDDILIQVANDHNAMLISNDLNVRVGAHCEGVETKAFRLREASKKDKEYKGFSFMKKEPQGKDVKSYRSKPNHYFVYKDRNKPEKYRIYRRKNNVLTLVKNDVYKNIEGITALNFYQKMAMDALLDPEISLVSLIGQAGTGKTLLALASAINLMKKGNYESISVGRSIIPVGKDLGALPGDADEKTRPYLAPIFDNLDVLAHANGDTFNTGYTKEMMEEELISIQPLSLIRGRTLNKKIFIIDEAQNLTLHEAKTLITRAGVGSKIILLGDPHQIDCPGLDRYNNGLSFVTNAFSGQKCASQVTLEKVERSELAELAVRLLKT